MMKYALVLSIDKVPTVAIESGSLEKIDDFMFENSINNPGDLFDYINKNNQYQDRHGEYTFEIYTLDRSRKKIELLYKKDIYKLKIECKELRDFEDVFFTRMINDNDFSIDFYVKYVYPLANLKDEQIQNKETMENKISALSLIKERNRYIESTKLDNIPLEDKRTAYLSYQNTFTRFCHGLIGVQNKQTKKWKAKYDEKRDLYTFYRKYKRQSVSNIHSYEEKEDEFDGEMLYGTNPDEGLRVNGMKYKDFIKKENRPSSFNVHDREDIRRFK